MAGWWSPLSVLLMNWIALGHNRNARNKRRQEAQQARDYAEWWHHYIGGQVQAQRLNIRPPQPF